MKKNALVIALGFALSGFAMGIPISISQTAASSHELGQVLWTGVLSGMVIGIGLGGLAACAAMRIWNRIG